MMAAVIVVAQVPILAPVLVAAAVLIGLSRVVLWVHYPSDVLAGGAIGLLIGSATNMLITLT